MSTTAAEEVIDIDHNATTPVAPEVADAMALYLREHFANLSSDHALGWRARKAIDEAREQVASLIGASADEIVFTSGSTESNKLAILGVPAAAAPTRRRIITSTIEHPATTASCGHLEADGWAISRIPVTAAGTLDPDAVSGALSTEVALVTVRLAQNKTGALMPIPAIAAPAHGGGAVLHTDAAQAIGKIPVSVDALGVDLCSIAGHKCYGPKGVGALDARRGTPIRPVLVGAG